MKLSLKESSLLLKFSTRFSRIKLHPPTGWFRARTSLLFRSETVSYFQLLQRPAIGVDCTSFDFSIQTDPNGIPIYSFRFELSTVSSVFRSRTPDSKAWTKPSNLNSQLQTASANRLSLRCSTVCREHFLFQESSLNDTLQPQRRFACLAVNGYFELRNALNKFNRRRPQVHKPGQKFASRNSEVDVQK